MISEQQKVVNNNQTVSCKVTFNTNGETEIRRFTCEARFAAVHDVVAQAFGGASAFVLRYTDDENEQVRFASDAEIAEAIRVGSVNGVLRLTAERAPNGTSTVAASTTPVASLASADDAAFWSGLPTWLQAKIVARTAEHQQSAAALPLDDVAHFACLPADVKSMIRERAARHAECRRAKLEKKELHHREVAIRLQAKAKKLLEKAAAQQEIAAKKAAKLDEKNENKTDEKKAADDATLWARVPAHIKERIATRWLAAARPADLAAPEVFAALPPHVRDRVRVHAAHHAEGAARRWWRRGRNDDDENDDVDHNAPDGERQRWRCWRGHGGHGHVRGAWRAWRAAEAAADPAATVVPPAHAGAAFENAPAASAVPKPAI